MTARPLPTSLPQMADTQNTLLEVRKLQLDTIERARRFRAAWDFEEHR